MDLFDSAIFDSAIFDTGAVAVADINPIIVWERSKRRHREREEAKARELEAARELATPEPVAEIIPEPAPLALPEITHDSAAVFGAVQDELQAALLLESQRLQAQLAAQMEVRRQLEAIARQQAEDEDAARAFLSWLMAA